MPLMADMPRKLLFLADLLHSVPELLKHLLEREGRREDEDVETWEHTGRKTDNLGGIDMIYDDIARMKE